MWILEDQAECIIRWRRWKASCETTWSGFQRDHRYCHCCQHHYLYPASSSSQSASLFSFYLWHVVLFQGSRWHNSHPHDRSQVVREGGQVVRPRKQGELFIWKCKKILTTRKTILKKYKLTLLWRLTRWRLMQHSSRFHFLKLKQVFNKNKRKENPSFNHLSVNRSSFLFSLVSNKLSACSTHV